MYKSRRWRWAILISTVAGAVLCAVGALVCLWEFVVIGLVANPRTIASYYFGSEAMLAHGGWHYTSARTDVWTN